jgi:CheY-like chemotaxis protein
MKPILEVDLLSSLERLDKDRGEYIRSNPPILVISDDPEALHHLAALLQAMGRTSVRLAQGGAAGLVALAEARDTPRVRCPQAVILDLPLGAGSQDTLPPGENGFSPEVNGFTLLETLCTESVFGEAIAFTFTGSDLTEAQKDRLEQLLEARHTPLSTGRSADIVPLEGRLTGQATPLLRRLQQALQILEPGTQTSHGPVQESGIQNTDTSSAKSSPRIWNL